MTGGRKCRGSLRCTSVELVVCWKAGSHERDERSIGSWWRRYGKGEQSSKRKLDYVGGSSLCVKHSPRWSMEHGVGRWRRDDRHESGRWTGRVGPDSGASRAKIALLGDRGQTSTLRVIRAKRRWAKSDVVMTCRAVECFGCCRRKDGVGQLVRRRLGRPAGQFP